MSLYLWQGTSFSFLSETSQKPGQEGNSPARIMEDKILDVVEWIKKNIPDRPQRGFELMRDKKEETEPIYYPNVK